MSSLATAVKEMEEIPAYLPNGAVLKDSVQRARDWLRDVDALQVGLKKKSVVNISEQLAAIPSSTPTPTTTHTPGQKKERNFATAVPQC